MEGKASEVDIEVREVTEDRTVPAYVAEFIGTFFLVFFICMILGVASGFRVTDLAVLGLLHAFILAMLIYTLGGTSGAHFNPAVTIALLTHRKIKPIDAVIYILLQLSAAVAAALAVKALLVDEADAINYGATVPGAFIDGKAFPALIAETLGTFVLMWAIMGMAVNPRGARDWAGLVIGITLGVLVWTIGPLTGAGFNPARSFGPALVSGEWTDFWVYVVGPIVGAALSAFAYNALVIAPAGRLEDRPIDHLE